MRSESATHQNHVELLLPVLVKYNIMVGALKRNVSYATKISWSNVGCPSKLVSIQNNRNGTETSFVTIRNKTFVLVVSLLYQNRDFSMFRLNRNKQKSNRNSLIWTIFWYFFRKFRVFQFFSVCFGLFRNTLFRLFRFYTETESFDVSIEPKQTEDQAKQFDREHILVLRVVLVCFETVLFVSIVSVRNTETDRNKTKPFVFGFTKQIETKPKQILF